MEIVKTRTARGRGRWGPDTYDVELLSCTQSWWDSARAERRTLTDFELRCSAPVGSRYFATESERDTFIAASFSELDLDPVEPPEARVVAPTSLHAVLGVPLTGVETAVGCLQLDWPDDYLVIYSGARIIEAAGTCEDGDAGFVAKLQSLTGRRLSAVDEVLDRGLVLTFEGPIDLEVNLREAGDGLVEAAEHSSRDHWSRGSSWTVAEPPFDSSWPS
ncbi:hypothetical protein [Cellulomonas sp. SLBN-39]|uniref:hypothetical protein n=1 Tax=Cellulomonas sp. SLBN-39 TaxID=2768446 RepID=UPI00114DCE76|nr:hypothetical protein [Cellulomonas sp. SLBN-39]TQL02673.1 hypothetical protein FBY24_1753 [Cellulomonas sp. SLBN-39]